MFVPYAASTALLADTIIRSTCGLSAREAAAVPILIVTLRVATNKREKLPVRLARVQIIRCWRPASVFIMQASIAGSLWNTHKHTDMSLSRLVHDHLTFIDRSCTKGDRFLGYNLHPTNPRRRPMSDSICIQRALQYLAPSDRLCSSCLATHRAKT